MEFWLLVVIGILLIIIFLWLLNYFRTQNCTRNRSAIY